jgi:hypothetical protein
VLVCTAAGARAEETRAPYGFAGTEIYKIQTAGRRLQSADFDRDGIGDLAFVNNEKARIDVFLRRPDGVPEEERDDEPNQVAEDLKFLRREVLTEKQVDDMVVADLNGDEVPDIVHFGKPAELVVAYNDGKGAFEKTRTFPAPDGLAAAGALAAGDLNGDGRADVVLMAERHVKVLFQGEDGQLKEPVRVPIALQGGASVAIQDVDGDGRKDLVLVATGDARPIRVRLQQSEGAFGPEIALETAPFRAYVFADVDPAPGTEILVIQRSSGLLRLLGLERREPDAATIALGALQTEPFETDASGKVRAVAVGDVNADGRSDVVLTEPGTAQVALHLQTGEGTLSSRRLFPSLAEAERIVAADLNDDGRAEVVVLSQREKTVGWSALDEEGRLSFPRPLAVVGDPYTLQAGDLDGDGRPELVVVGKKDDKWHVSLFGVGDGAFDVASSFVLEGLDGKKDEPSDLMLADVNQDGATDLLLFDLYRVMRVWRAVQRQDAPVGSSFEAVDAGPSYGGSLVEKKRSAEVAAVDVDRDGKAELLVASRNFARALVLSNGRLGVKDQVNARGATSQLKSVAGADLTGDGVPEVVALDGEGNVLTLLSPDEQGVYQVVHNMMLGAEFDRVVPADLDGDGTPDLLLVGRDRFGVVHTRGRVLELAERATYESKAQDAWLYDVAVGDLNGDGSPDVAAIDTRNSSMELLAYEPGKGFDLALKWRVFEKKLYTRDRGAAPHEAVVADVTGDGLLDLSLLAHDRLLVHPQDE